MTTILKKRTDHNILVNQRRLIVSWLTPALTHASGRLKAILALANYEILDWVAPMEFLEVMRSCAAHCIPLTAGEDVCDGSGSLRHLLVSLPRLLPLRVPPQRDHQFAHHPAHILGLLLAGHGELHDQSNHLLLHERKVLLRTYRGTSDATCGRQQNG